MPQIRLNHTDATELAEPLQLLNDWLTADPDTLHTSLTHYIGHPASGRRPHPMPPPRNDNRNDNPGVPCPVCRTRFTPIRRQAYCTPACRQAAWRARHPTTAPTTALPPRTPRRDYTVYTCPNCDTRSLGRQWCPDCNRPALRIDLGGLCPHCDEPVAISDLTSQHPQPPATD